jgi:hypothetical protein
VISVLSSSSAIVGERLSSAAGYVFLSALAGAVYALVAILLPVRHAAETAARAGSSFRSVLRETALAPAALALFAAAVAITAAVLYPHHAITMFGWHGWLHEIFQ